MICMATLDREALVTDNMGLVYYLAKLLYAVNGRVKAMGLDEAQGVGFLALVKAAKNFDEALDIQFNTYCTVCIKRSILRAANKQAPHLGLQAEAEIEGRDTGNSEDESFWDLVYRDCSPTERRVLKQHYLQNLSMRQIAAQSPGGKSYQTASMAHQRALKKVKQRLETHPTYKNLVDPI